MNFRKTICTTLTALLLISGAAALAKAQQSPSPAAASRQALDDAWWTGPMLAPNASTLPRGHLLIEPYIFDVIADGLFDSHGIQRSVAHSHGLGSLTYINYGLADKWTVGMIPTAGYNLVGSGSSSAGIGLGDLTVQAQYRLRKFSEDSWLPTISVNVQETFPTGKYDRLGTRPSDGFGSGAYTTTLALYSQTYFWLPNHRILRMRFNVSQALSKNVSVQDISVYGTAEGFRGHASPGSTGLVDASWEYSVTRSWVLALDAVYRHQTDTRVVGQNTLVPNSPIIRTDLGTTDAFALAPALEYSWKPSIGVLLGVRLIPVGRNTPATITPAIAINYVH